MVLKPATAAIILAKSEVFTSAMNFKNIVPMQSQILLESMLCAGMSAILFINRFFKEFRHLLRQQIQHL